MSETTEVITPWWIALSPAGFATSISGWFVEAFTGVDPWSQFVETTTGGKYSLSKSTMETNPIALAMGGLFQAILPWVILLVVIVVGLVLLWKLGIPWIVKKIGGYIL